MAHPSLPAVLAVTLLPLTLATPAFAQPPPAPAAATPPAAAADWTSWRLETFINEIRMRIMSWEKRPLEKVVYLTASPSGGRDSGALLIEQAYVEGLPAELDAILATSDLQGVVTDWASGGESVLLGEYLVRVCHNLAASGVIPPLSKIGAILAGDLYSSPDALERGASGNVNAVWSAFACAFRWVAGVQGNHDQFGAAKERARLLENNKLHMLDGDVVELDGLRVGGVSLIIGKPSKPGRRSEAEFFRRLDRVLSNKPDIVVLHEGPNGDHIQRGSSAIRDMLLDTPVSFTICGHRHWASPTHEPLRAVQFLNVDKRAVLLTRHQPAQ